jgi:hypothetical protein
MSIATLTDESLDTMTSVATAPKMLAAMVGKGANFANTPGQDEGEPVMQQVRWPTRCLCVCGSHAAGCTCTSARAGVLPLPACCRVCGGTCCGP